MGKQKIKKQRVKKEKIKRTLKEELDYLQAEQFKCNVGSRSWDRYRKRINILYIKLGQRAEGK